MEYGVIYSITNTTNAKRYIGQTIKLTQRLKQHRSCLRSNVHHNNHLQNAWNKYGEDNFKFEVIENDVPVEIINKVEIYWISYYDTFKGDGYNLCKGGEGVKGYNWSEEEKKRMSEQRSGEKSVHSFFGTETAIEIIKDKKNGMSTGKIIEKYGISQAVINNILNRKHWTTKDFPEEELPKIKYIKKINKKTALKILEMRKNNMPYYKIAERLPISLETIRQVCLGNHSICKYIDFDFSILVKRIDSSGLNNPKAKIDVETAKSILKDRENGMFYKELGKKYNVSQGALSEIIKGRHWTIKKMKENSKK